MDPRDAAWRWKRTWEAAWPHRDAEAIVGATVLRFDADGKVVDHRDYWNHVEERVAPYAGW